MAFRDLTVDNPHNLYCKSLTISNIKTRSITFPEAYGAVGDGSTDDSTAINNLISDAKETTTPYKLSRKIIGDGEKQYKVPSISNPYGVEFDNSTMKLINSKGMVINHDYSNVMYFGHEFMWGWFRKLMKRTNVKICFTGDSTTNGSSLS